MNGTEPMEVSQVIKPENVTLNLAAASKTRLLQILSERAGKALNISDREILAALQNREKLGSTGVGSGIAIPHAPVAGVEVPYGLFVRLAKPIEFESIDDVPVDIVCVLLTPAENPAAHLSVLSRIARQLRSSDILRRIRSASNQEQVYSAITECAQ